MPRATKPMRRKRMKSSKKTRLRRAELLVKDCAARDAVFERDEFKCVRCGKSQGIQWAHVVSRSIKALRHLPENALTMCGGCHLFWWHKHPLEAISWFQQTYPERYKLLMEMRKA